MEHLQLFFPAITLCFMLSIVHAYLGLHVIEREVIFIDLSLAQVAALGGALAILIGIPHENYIKSYLASLAVTLIAALFLAFARRLEKKFSLEALIGILYGFSSAVTLLLLDREPHGLEVVKSSLIGNILFVDWHDVLFAGSIYLPIIILIFFFHNKLTQSGQTRSHWLWDFLFFGIFGAVVASSTKYAGVLMVFSLLVTPNLIAKGLFNQMKCRLTFGIIFNIVISTLGLILSYKFDYPVGALVVALGTGSILIFILVFAFFHKEKTLDKCKT
jgi:zinc/manganese transport system permease protein